MTREELKKWQFEKTGCSNLPDTYGGSVLILRYKLERESESGLLETEEAQMSSPFNVALGLVLDMGPDAFHGENYFPSGPYFEIGQEIKYLTGRCSGFAMKTDDGSNLIELGWIYCNNVQGGWPKGVKAPRLYPPSPERVL